MSDRDEAGFPLPGLMGRDRAKTSYRRPARRCTESARLGSDHAKYLINKEKSTKMALVFALEGQF